MGEVWRGIHLRTRTPVAIKVMMGARARHRQYREAFLNEVRAVASLDHGGIVLVFDHGHISEEAQQISGGRLVADSPYLVMELASRGSLDQVRGVFAWPDLKRILLSVLDALAHAHARGVIHRDIKPGNILVASDQDQRPGLKLTDFGLAHALDDTEKEGAENRAGTPRYMAPELFDGAWRDFGPWTDLYCLGCVAYELSSRQPIMDGQTYQDLKRQHRYEPPRPLRPLQDVPEGFDRWIARLCEKRPHDRFERAADAAWALLRLDDGELQGHASRVFSADDNSVIFDDKTEIGNPSTLFFRTQGGPEPVGFRQTTARSNAQTAIFSEGALADDETFLYREPPSHSTGIRRSVDLNTEVMTPLERALPPAPLTWRGDSKAERRPEVHLIDVGLNMFPLRTIRLVGRTTERDQVWEQLTKVRATGTARSILLTGSAGVGKSRFATWVCERAHELGAATILHATHSPIAGPADGLSRAVASHLGCVGLSRAETRRRTRRLLGLQGVKDDYEWDALTEVMVSGTAERQVARAKPIRFGAPAERYVLLLRLLARTSRERPVILWLDDVQWSSDSLWFVQYLMGQQALTPTPVLVLMTARTETLAERPLESFIVSQLMRSGNASTIDMPPLPEQERAQLVSELLCLSGDLEAKVEERTAGNPLFATELVGDWVSRGVLKVGSFGFELVEGEEAVLPDNLHAIWLARLERALEGFDAEAVAAVEIAAVLGQDVDLDDWRASCAEAGIELSFDVVYQLVNARLARPGDNVWSFAHGMLRDSLEASARDGGRWTHHNRACAAMLMHRYDRRQPGLAERLGRHLLEAGEHARALGALLRGVQERLASSEFRVARELIELWQEAADFLALDSSDPQLGTGWLLQLELAKVEGRLDDAAALAKRAVREAKKNQWDAVLPRALRAHGEIATLRGDLADATQSIGYARTLYEKGGKRRGTRDCLLGQGEIALRRGDLARSTKLFRQALVLSQKLGDIAEVAACLQSLAGVLEQRSQIDLAWDMLGQALELYDKIGGRLGLAKCFEALGRLAVRKGDPAEASHQYERALATFEQLGARNSIVACHVGLADVDRQRGRHTAATAGYRRALKLSETGVGDGLVAQINLGCLLLTDGHYAEARQLLEQARDVASMSGRRTLLACAHANLLPCDADSGQWLKWGIHFNRAASLIEETGFVHPDVAFALQLGGLLAAGEGKLPQATQAFELSSRQWAALGRDDKVVEIEALTASMGHS